MFKRLKIDIPKVKDEYIYVYILRYEINMEGNIRYIDEQHRSLRMEEWLNIIANAKNLITNSYHGMIMALFAHVPFVVLLGEGRESGMNDRFYTLLSELGLENRLALKVDEVQAVLAKPIDCKK